MSMKSDTVEGGLIDTPRQFQADRNFMQDCEISATPARSLAEHEQSVRWDEMSLTMRQFYQAPTRNVG